MKKVNVLNFEKFLSNLKLNKFDKEIRAAIISNSLLANRIVKEFEECAQEARTRYFDGLDEEVALLTDFRQKFSNATTNEEKQIIDKECTEKCKNALIAEKEFIDFINNIGEEEITTPFVKINRDSFVDQCADADIEITMNTLETLSELFN